MNEDWKKSLFALRGNFESPDPAEEENVSLNEPETGQKTPLNIVTDKKRRNGKIATIIEGLTEPREKVESLARELKQKLGVGGSVRDGEILIQGNHKEAVKKRLLELGYIIKNKC